MNGGSETGIILILVDKDSTRLESPPPHLCVESKEAESGMLCKLTVPVFHQMLKVVAHGHSVKCACVTYVMYGDIISNEVHYRLVTELAQLY